MASSNYVRKSFHLHLNIVFLLRWRWLLTMASLVLFSPRVTFAMSPSCPLNISILQSSLFASKQAKLQGDTQEKCLSIRQALDFLVAVHVHETGNFLLPPDMASSCIQGLQTQLSSDLSNETLKTLCNLDQAVLEQGSTVCPDFVNVSDFMAAIPTTLLKGLNSSCANPLHDSASCSHCTAAVVNSVIYNTSSSCLDFSSIYAAGVVNRAGPLDLSTLNCIFLIGSSDSEGKLPAYAIALVVLAGILLTSSLAALIMYFLRRKLYPAQGGATAATPSVPRTSVCFGIDEIKKATNNFSNLSIIGSGGFGNVYKGVLKDGTQIAVKRFKNCSPSGDADFVHEVEMISSVRHRNLVPLLGWSVGSTSAGGHERIMVFEYMPNGSLQDHISAKAKEKLDWETRQRIAIGTARGIAYLHDGAQPAIIHRDIKPSNILLDLNFNARVADFGLARFAREGVTHMTTGVAGTRGFVAPEYFMYGQLNDKSDVYSFGIVLLELLTGKSTLVLPPKLEVSEPLPLADWAYFMLKASRVRELLDETMQVSGLNEEVIERYLRVALLCSHSQVSHRPTMAQALKMLEDDVHVPPSLPEWPMPLTMGVSEIGNLFEISTEVQASKEVIKPHPREEVICNLVLESWPEDDSCSLLQNSSQLS